jgi:plasmid stabilization system protein ParE
MTTVRLSRRVKEDLRSIGLYTKETWGSGQAERYLAALERCVKLLACHPELGRTCGGIRPGLYRFEKGKHVVF